MGLVATIVPSRQGDIRSPLAAGGVFHMPGYITEGAVRRISGPPDWTVLPGAAAAIIRGNTNAMFSGAAFNNSAGVFNPYGWRPSGDGTGAYNPHDAAYQRIYGYLPYQEGFLSGALGATREPCRVSSSGAVQCDTVEDAALQATVEAIKTQQAVRKAEKWKLVLSVVSTAALVTLTVAAIAGGRKKGR
jgi:hypothetical protein